MVEYMQQYDTVYPEDSLLSQELALQGQKILPDACQKKLAYDDFICGFKSWRIWMLLAYQDIQLRYRRSVLGPFWITLSMAITVYSMGYLYAHLFHQELANYYPFLVTGMLTWTFISSIITEVTDGFVASEGMIKQIKLPYSLYMHRIGCRNLLIFVHNLAVMIPIMIIFHDTSKINWYTLILIPGIVVIYINTISFGLIISMIGSRYRDMAQVTKSLLQVIFFMTPIMWAPDVLGPDKQYIVYLNPLYSLIEIIRKPLLGAPPSLRSIFTALIVTVLGVAICIKFFTRYRSRLVYWL